VESEGRFHDLVNLLPEMVLETDLTGNITYANKVAIKQLQLSFAKDTGTNFSSSSEKTNVKKPKEISEILSRENLPN